MDRQTGLTGLVLAAALGVITTILWGRLTDKIGRRKLYLAGTAGMILFGFPIFLMINTAVPFLIILVYIIGLPILHDMLAGSQGGWFSELFHANTRTSGASIGYQFSAAISGFIPLIAAATAAAWGWGGVSIVYMGCGAIGLIAALVTRETWGRRERTAVDQLIAAGK